MASWEKIAVLHMIKENKNVLFGTFSNEITKQSKCEMWTQVKDLAESLGLVSGKPWQYVRDTIWPNWRKRTLAKRDNVRTAGTGKKTGLTEIDHLVLDILGNENMEITGLRVTDSFDTNESEILNEHDPSLDLNDSFDTPPVTVVEGTSDTNTSAMEGKPRNVTKGRRRTPTPEADDEERKRRKLNLQIDFFELSNRKLKLENTECEADEAMKRRKLDLQIEFFELSNRKLKLEIAAREAEQMKKRRKRDLQIEFLELSNKKLKLEILQLEQTLRIPRSKYTQSLPNNSVHENGTNNCIINFKEENVTINDDETEDVILS